MRLRFIAAIAAWGIVLIGPSPSFAWPVDGTLKPLDHPDEERALVYQGTLSMTAVTGRIIPLINYESRLSYLQHHESRLWMLATSRYFLSPQVALTTWRFRELSCARWSTAQRAGARIAWTG